MGVIYKGNYKPRFRGYRVAFALVTIVDGLVGLAVAPFGYSSEILSNYCAWNLRKDVERRRAAREAIKAERGW
jgi:hypothetical protein